MKSLYFILFWLTLNCSAQQFVAIKVYDFNDGNIHYGFNPIPNDTTIEGSSAQEIVNFWTIPDYQLGGNTRLKEANVRLVYSIFKNMTSGWFSMNVFAFSDSITTLYQSGWIPQAFTKVQFTVSGGKISGEFRDIYLCTDPILPVPFRDTIRVSGFFKGVQF